MAPPWRRCCVRGWTPDKPPPHVGVLLGNTPVFSALLVAAALDGVVPVGLNPPARRHLRRHRHADCQLVLTDAVPRLYDDHADGMRCWTSSRRRGPTNCTPSAARPSGAPNRDDDLFMLIFTSGTGGESRRCAALTKGRGARRDARRTLRSDRRDDVFYLSMPLFHSNAVMAGWAPAVAARGSIVLRRKFSASSFIADARRFGASYAIRRKADVPTSSRRRNAR